MDQKMTVSEAIAARHSTRAFLDRPVSGELLRTLLERASRAPSGGNLQPWRVYALSGAPLATHAADRTQGHRCHYADGMLRCA